MSASHTLTRTRHELLRPSGRYHPSRLSRVQSTLATRAIDALLVFQPSAVRYLTGFTGSNGLLVVRRRSARFLTDGRYREQGREELGRTVGISIVSGSLFEAAVRLRFVSKDHVIGFDESDLTCSRYRELRRLLPGSLLRPVAGIVESFSAVKDKSEINAIASATRISDEVFTAILALIRPGVLERDLALEISYRQRRLGAEKDSFDPIVASGPRTAMPHAKASTRRMQAGEPVLLDFGCVVDGYGSDISRTVFIGAPHPKLRKVYDLVRSAQRAGIEKVKAGCAANVVDYAARSVITRGGFGKQFPHSLGHGIGIDVHEHPRIASSSKEILQVGNVITIEPGVYIPGIGGVRIEDDVLVNNDGCELLTHSTRDLTQL